MTDYRSMINQLLAAPPQPTQMGGVSASGRPLYNESGGATYSEKTVTFPMMGKWATFPAVDAKGNIQSEDQVWDYVRAHGPVDPVTGEQFPLFDTRDEAERYARMRSRTR